MTNKLSTFGRTSEIEMALLEARSRNFLCDSPITAHGQNDSGAPDRSNKYGAKPTTRFLASAIQHVKTEVRCSCRIEEVENHLQRMRKQMAGRQAGTRQANLPRISSPPPQTPPSSTAASTWACGHGKAVSPRRRRRHRNLPRQCHCHIVTMVAGWTERRTGGIWIVLGAA